MRTQVEIAEKLGISDRWLRKLIADGVIKPPAKRGGLDFEDVARQYIAHQAEEIARLKADAASKQAQLDGLTENPDGIVKSNHEARRMKALADIAEMRAAQTRGDLIPSSQVGDAVTMAVQTMVSRLRSIPSKMANKIGARDPAAAEGVIRSEIDEALASLAEIDVRGGAEPADVD